MSPILPRKLRTALSFKKERARDCSVGKFQDLTSTQAGRLFELQPECYPLKSACEFLNVSPQLLLHLGSVGRLTFFVNVSGLGGYWHEIAGGIISEEKSYVELTSGFLGLPRRYASQLEANGSASIPLLEFRDCFDYPVVKIKPRESQEFTPLWLDGELVFYLQKPILVKTTDVMLMKPLPKVRSTDKAGRRKA